MTECSALHPYYYSRHATHDLNLQRLLSIRERFGNAYVMNAMCQGHGSLVRRLALQSTLTKHTGCVNHLRWNRTGTLLASGSDDTKLIIWDYATSQPRHVIDTGHVLNIFAVCFIPDTNDHILASGAMDKEVRIHYAPFRPGLTKRFRVHRGRVKDIASSEGVSKVFWSVAEDGIVHQFDLRALPRSAPSSEATDDDPSGVLIRLGRNRHHGSALRGMAMAIHPLDPTKVVIACGDFYSRLYDRRMLRVQCTDEATIPIQRFAPPHLHLDHSCDLSTQRQHEDIHGTSIQFNHDGTEVLTNYHNDHIYLFSTNNSSMPVQMYEPPEPEPTPVVMEANISSQKRWWHGAQMDMPTQDVALSYEQVEQLFQEGNEYVEAKAYTKALACYIQICSTKSLSTMVPIAFLKDLYRTIAKVYMLREWQADAYMACVYAKLAWTLDEDDSGIEQTYIEALSCAHHVHHVIFRAKCFLDKYERIEDEVIQQQCDVVKHCLESATKRISTQRQRRDRRLRIVQRSRNLDNENESDSSDGGELLIEERPLVEERPSTPTATLNEPIFSDEESFWNRDMVCVNYNPKRRYIGYCNLQTDIKEATFFGPNDAFIIAGSDDGHAYIWNKHTAKLVNVLPADADIVNCVQPHPFDSCIATSGIEHVIRLWSPTSEERISLPTEEDLLKRIEENQVQMRESGQYFDLSGGRNNLIRLIFQAGEHEGVQECATS